MKPTRHILLSGMFVVAVMAVAPSAQAQQTTGTPGSPNATTTTDGKHLPLPEPEFGGEIKTKATESTPWWAPRVVPPKGAPNVLLIMTDDCGFGAPSTFGGVVPTPALDRVAKAGLRYTNFHSTSLCSPTRAALITGRNHHVAGFGVVGEITTGYPGYDSIILKANGTIGNILKENGYATSWFGKEHNTPSYQATAAGPFDQWPVGMGFEYFYGFVGGDASQWQPNLFRNTTPIYLSGDNGASAEGMVNGTPNEFATMNGIPVPVKAQYLWYPFWGSDKTFPHYAAPWAWAMSTPFKWVKQVASHFGGAAQGVAMSWPGHIKDVGGVRTQFHHIIDIAPTILEAAGIPQPETINGVVQRPLDGVSMAYTWDKPGASIPSKRTTQYFEMLGNRAIYHEG